MGGRPIWPGLLRHFGDDCTVIWFGGAPAVRAPLHSSHQSDVYVPDGEGARVAQGTGAAVDDDVLMPCSYLSPAWCSSRPFPDPALEPAHVDPVHADVGVMCHTGQEDSDQEERERQHTSK